jgi:MFS family permease
LPSLTLIALGLALLAASATRRAGGRGDRVRQRLRVRLSRLRRPRDGQVDAARRGAAFGGILAAFDTGIGTGSILTGLIIDRFGYSRAYVAAAFLAALSIPYFVLAEKRLMKARDRPRSVSPAGAG